jgi:hypothetical protein
MGGCWPHRERRVGEFLVEAGEHGALRVGLSLPGVRLVTWTAWACAQGWA